MDAVMAIITYILCDLDFLGLWKVDCVEMQTKWKIDDIYFSTITWGKYYIECKSGVIDDPMLWYMFSNSYEISNKNESNRIIFWVSKSELNSLTSLLQNIGSSPQDLSRRLLSQKAINLKSIEIYKMVEHIIIFKKYTINEQKAKVSWDSSNSTRSNRSVITCDELDNIWAIYSFLKKIKIEYIENESSISLITAKFSIDRKKAYAVYYTIEHHLRILLERHKFYKHDLLEILKNFLLEDIQEQIIPSFWVEWQPPIV